MTLRLDWLDNVVRAKRPPRLSVVLPYPEVNKLLQLIYGTNGLIAQLLYGTGMQLPFNLIDEIKEDKKVRLDRFDQKIKGGSKESIDTDPFDPLCHSQ